MAVQSDYSAYYHNGDMVILVINNYLYNSVNIIRVVINGLQKRSRVLGMIIRVRARDMKAEARRHQNITKQNRTIQSTTALSIQLSLLIAFMAKASSYIIGKFVTSI
jgi:hypothetical protein